MVLRDDPDFLDGLVEDLLPQPAELPPYEVEPIVELAPPSQTYYAPPVLAVTINEKAVTSNSFITGTIFLNPPKVMDDVVVWLEIVKTEQALETGSLAKKSIAKKTTKVITSSCIPMTTVLEPGKRYNLPFSLQFPSTEGYRLCPCSAPSDHDDSGDCEKQEYLQYHHCDFPPTFGGYDIEQSSLPCSITYGINAHLEDMPNKSVCQFKFSPCVATLDLSNFVDAKGLSMERDLSFTSTFNKRTWFSKGSPDGVLVATASPIYHAPKLSLMGRISIALKYLANDKVSSSIKSQELQIMSASCSIYKRVYGTCTGMTNVLDKLPTNSVCEYKLPLGILQVDTYLVSTGPAKWDLKLWYTLPDSTLLNLPSFVSCFSAVTYEMEIKIKHTWGSTKVRVPFVLRKENLPAYCSTLTATSIPTFV